MLLTISKLSKAYGDNQVLANVSLTMHAGDKVGLVGANGVGKSTLIKLIAGAETPDAGVITLAAGVEVGYLPQVLTAGDALTLEELLAQSQAHVHAVEMRLHEVEALLAQADGAALDELLADYGRLSEAFDRLGGYALAHRTARVLDGMGVSASARDRPLAWPCGV